MKIKYILLIPTFILASCTTIRTTSKTRNAHAKSFSFIVIGDTPYTEIDTLMIQKAIPIIKSSPPPFVIHIGDYKGGGSECTSDHDDNHHHMIEKLSPIPVFYTPGDNEWTDCDRNNDPKTNTPYSELGRLSIIRNKFFKSLPSHSSHLKPAHQSTAPENVTWHYNGVRFLTLHIVGTNNGRDEILGDSLEQARTVVNLRDEANLKWLTTVFDIAIKEHASAIVIAIHADMTDVEDKPIDIMCTSVTRSKHHECDAFTELRASIRDHAIQFAKPILLIHGDTAPYTIGQTFAGEEANNFWRLNAAGDAGPGYGISDITEVRVDTSLQQPFSAVGVITGVQPASDLTILK